jgi:hypothetical protein
MLVSPLTSPLTSALLSPSQCEKMKATVQKCVQTPRHSKEALNRLNQAIQQLKMEVGGTQSQERHWGWGLG